MNSRRWLITAAACIAVFSLLAIYKVQQIRAAIAFGESFPEPSETVIAEEVQLFPFQSRIETTGTVVAPQWVELRNEIEGRISAVNFASGDLVRGDSVLVQLDVSEEQARLRGAKSRAELARINLRRFEKLLANKTISQEQFDRASAEYDVTLADIEALEAVIDKKTLRAPFDAYAGIHQLNVGEYLQQNTLITTLVGVSDHTWVDFHLPMKQATIPLGTAVEIRSDSPRQSPVDGEIIARESVVSASSRTLNFRARINAPSNALTANSLVKVSVIRPAVQEVPRIAVTGLRRDTMGEFVYILKPDRTSKGYRAQRRNVVTGNRDAERVVILSGLEAGELVAAEGTFKLRDNLLVFVEEKISATNIKDVDTPQLQESGQPPAAEGLANEASAAEAGDQ
ncbi:MAG: efflux RND transporter periplasmic adaptor subunit [bacterium]